MYHLLSITKGRSHSYEDGLLVYNAIKEDLLAGRKVELYWGRAIAVTNFMYGLFTGIINDIGFDEMQRLLHIRASSFNMPIIMNYVVYLNELKKQNKL